MVENLSEPAPTKYLTAVAQDREELDWFINLLRGENVGSYLEIGSKFGGSLWHIANSLPPGARVVSVDLPAGFGGSPDGLANLKVCIAELKRLRYDAHLILGNSTDKKIIAQVAQLGPFDAIFIDADHGLAGVTADWRNYGPMARIVGFHDIGWRRPPDWRGYRIDVPILWDQLKRRHRHQEIMRKKKDDGIGVLWR
jgi:methyltransferase family protein